MEPKTNIFRNDIEELLRIHDRLERHLNKWQSRHPEYKYNLEIISEPTGFCLKAIVYEEQQY